MLPNVPVDFTNLDDEGRIQVVQPENINGLTEGSLVKLVNNAGRVARYATLYHIDGDVYYFRVQE